MKRLRVLCLLLLTAGIWPLASVRAQTPQTIHYQGRLLNGTNLYNGVASLQFNLYTSETAVVQFYQCTSQVTVVDGLYSARLGEFETLGTLADALTNAQVFLGVVVNGLTLSPRERLGSVAYALRSQTALGVVPGGVTTAMLGDGAVTGSKLASGAVSNTALAGEVLANIAARADSNIVWTALHAITSSQIVDGTISNTDIAANAGIAGSKLAVNTVGSRELADSIDIGATNVSGQLDIYRTSSNTPAISLIGFASQISTYGSDGLEQIRLWGSGWGEIFLYDGSPENRLAVSLSANSTAGGLLELADNTGNVRVIADANRSNQAAIVSIAGTGSATTVVLDGGTSSGGSVALRDPSGSTRARLVAGSSAVPSELSLFNKSGVEAVAISSGGTNFMLGPLAIGTNVVEAPFHVVEGASGADQAVPDSIAVFERSADSYITMKAGTNSIQGLVFATSVSNHDAAIIYNFQNERSLRFRTRGSVTRMIITTNGNVGIGTTDPTNRLHVIGTVQANALVTGSDVNAKENIAPVSAEKILAGVVALPIATWNFRDDPSGTHLGPMAQDFRAAFGLGNTDTGIFTVDADGVALAAIQALARQNAELRLSNAELKRQNEDVLKQLDEVLRRLQALATK